MICRRLCPNDPVRIHYLAQSITFGQQLISTRFIIKFTDHGTGNGGNALMLLGLCMALPLRWPLVVHARNVARLTRYLLCLWYRLAYRSWSRPIHASTRPSSQSQFEMGKHSSLDLHFLTLTNWSSYSVDGDFQSKLADSIPIQSNLNITLRRSKHIFDILCNLIVKLRQIRELHLPNSISQVAPWRFSPHLRPSRFQVLQ